MNDVEPNKYPVLITSIESQYKRILACTKNIIKCADVNRIVTQVDELTEAEQNMLNNIRIHHIQLHTAVMNILDLENVKILATVNVQNLVFLKQKFQKHPDFLQEVVLQLSFPCIE